MSAPLSGIQYLPASFADHSGKLFWKDDQLYRSICASKENLYQDFFNRKIAEDLIKKRLLVSTELVTADKSFPTPLVLRHRRVPVISYPPEWCAGMLKSAALHVLDLEAELTAGGFTLEDAHSWNVLFEGPHPLFVDFGAIGRADRQVPWKGEPSFRNFMLNPLKIMSAGYFQMARKLLEDNGRGITDSDSCVFTRHHNPAAVIAEPAGRLLDRAGRKLRGDRSDRAVRVKKLRRQVENLKIDLRPTEWTEYYEGESLSLSSDAAWNLKQKTVHKILKSARPASVLDVGTNRGWYAKLAHSLGSRVTAVDADAECVERLYRDAAAENLNILTLVMDFLCASPGGGVAGTEFLPASSRLRSDLVMALALVHHFAFKRRVSFEVMAALFSEFSNRWLLTEFIPKEDQYVSRWWTEDFDWYTQDGFVNCLKKHFSRVEILESHPKPRKLILCEKK